MINNENTGEFDPKNKTEEATITISDKDISEFYDKHKVNNFVPPDDKQAKEKKRKRRKANYTVYAGIVLTTLVLCVSLLLSLFIIVVGRDVLGIESNSNEFTVYVPDGSTTSDIAGILHDEGVIEYKKVFVALAKLMDADGNMYPGDINVSYNMSYADIIDGLMTAREAKETATVTFPEGITLLSAGRLLEEKGVCSADEFIYTFNSTVLGFEFEKSVSSSSLKLYKYEGYLFPDTYEFYVGDSVYNVVKKIKTKTDEVLNSERIALAAEKGLTIDQVVTLASIVQREAGDSSQMKPIASVFLNRLDNHDTFPRLQSDTTYSYIDNVIKKVLTVEYQEMYDAYDTYTCIGLPIGAICNPGEEAIDAVLNPADTDYYFFCSNIETKETFFAKTIDEHEDNKKKAGLS